MNSRKRILVLGGGPGGYTAAFLFSDIGMNVTLVETGGKLGGVCLRSGCIPSKALLHAGQLIHSARTAKAMGIDFGEPQIHLDTLRKWKNDLICKMDRGLIGLAKKRKVQIVQEYGKFLDKNTLQAGNEIIEFDIAVIATGSSPTISQPFDIKTPLLMDSTLALDLPDIPKRLLVVGGGYIGLEMGTFYSALGSKVDLIEITNELLPGIDRDLVRPLEIKLNREFGEIRLNTNVKTVELMEDKVKVMTKGGLGSQTEVYDRILISVGRTPNSKDLGLENVGIERDKKGFITTDMFGRTTQSNIYAIGDVIGGSMLAHKASNEAKVLVEHLNGTERIEKPTIIPAVVYTDPEIAWAGITENEAKIAGTKISVAKFYWQASGRAACIGRNDGLTKLLCDPVTNRILGIGITGPGAGELIAEGVLAIEQKLTAKDIANTVHPHPTLSETLMEAAEVYLGKSTHLYKH